MRIKLLLFDFFGTLAFSQRPRSTKDFFLALEKFGIEIKTKDEETHFISLFSNLLGKAESRLDLSKKLLSRLVKKVNRDIVEDFGIFLRENLIFKLYDDVSEIIHLPFKKAILTANARFLLEELGLDKFFRLFTPKETKHLKPDPRAFLVPLEKMKVSVKEALMVGDELERDLMPAQNLGMRTILIDRENKIKDTSIEKINSLKEIKKILGL
jgi:HAD superfamily hydrolase (TIGR01509 family)